MFLTNKQYNVQDFLRALQFIPPKGMSVAYFITPQEINLPDGAEDFVQRDKDIPPDESQTYVMQPPEMKIDQATTPAEYSIWEPGELGRRQPTPNILPDITDPGEQELGSPFVKVLSESRIFGTDIKLIENFHMFQKNTVFHCVPKKIREARGLGQKIPKYFFDHKDYGPKTREKKNFIKKDIYDEGDFVYIKGSSWEHKIDSVQIEGDDIKYYALKRPGDGTWVGHNDVRGIEASSLD
jgi:hypothetical protein